MNPLLQRWISADPLEVHDASSGEPNVYAYVSGRALKNIDPVGLTACDTCQAIAQSEEQEFDATVRSPTNAMISDLDRRIDALGEEAQIEYSQSLEASRLGYEDYGRARAQRGDALTARAVELGEVRSDLQAFLDVVEGQHQERQAYLTQEIMLGSGRVETRASLDAERTLQTIESKVKGGMLGVAAEGAYAISLAVTQTEYSRDTYLAVLELGRAVNDFVEASVPLSQRNDAAAPPVEGVDYSPATKQSQSQRPAVSRPAEKMKPSLRQRLSDMQTKRHMRNPPPMRTRPAGGPKPPRP